MTGISFVEEVVPVAATSITVSASVLLMKVYHESVCQLESSLMICISHVGSNHCLSLETINSGKAKVEVSTSLFALGHAPKGQMTFIV